MHPFLAKCDQALAEITAQGRYRRFVALEKLADRFPYYQVTMEGRTRDILVWSSNDYLAMGTDPVVIEASIEAARRMGAGAGGTRNIAGSSPLHVALEEELADLHGKEAALLFTSGYVSNWASLATLASRIPGCVVVSDASNHASMLDPPVVGLYIPRQVAFFARKTLWKPGLASWWLDGVGAIPVDRDGGADVAAIKRVLQSLRQGSVVILFPEGTRSRDGRLQGAKPGIGLIACRTGMPVVPARVFGSYDAFGRDGKLRLGTRVSVRYGPALKPGDYDCPDDGKERYLRAAGRIMAAIERIELPPEIVV